MKRYLLIGSSITVGILILALILYYGSSQYAPGNYVNAETYELNAEEAKVISIVNDFKINFPEYKVPDTLRLFDGRNGTEDYWYAIYFYYPLENEIIFCWTRPAKKGKTTLAFVSVNNGLNLGHWRTINKDFNHSDNSQQKEKFEHRILIKVKEKIPG